MTPRTYTQRQRAEAAEETRRRILDAVYHRLGDAPTEPVSIERVAALAGVSRSTVYLAFGSRAGLFDALGEDLRRAGGFDQAVDLAHTHSTREGLLASIRASVPVFENHREVLRVLYSMAHLDPDSVGGAVRRLGDGRAADLAAYAERLAAEEELNPAISVDEAVDVLWAVTGFEFFDQLHTGRALPAETCADLMVATVERAVLR